jgi:hypothetical protein
MYGTFLGNYEPMKKKLSYLFIRINYQAKSINKELCTSHQKKEKKKEGTSRKSGAF